MTIEDTLRRELRDVTTGHVVDSRLDQTLAAGRARRRRRGVLRGAVATGLGCVLVVGLAVVTGTDDSDRAGDPQWALALPPEEVNQHIVDMVRGQLPAGADVTDVDMRAYGPDPDPDTGQAIGSTEDPAPLPRSDWDQAVSWSVHVELGDGHFVSVELFHAAGETEGDADTTCRQDLRAGSYQECEVSTDVSTGALTIYRLAAARQISPNGGWYVGEPSSFDPDRLWFLSEVEVQPGGDFLVRVEEGVKAPERAIAMAAMALSRADLAAIAVDDGLLSAG